MASDIKIDIINKSQDPSKGDIVIFQKNYPTGDQMMEDDKLFPVVWEVKHYFEVLNKHLIIHQDDLILYAFNEKGIAAPEIPVYGGQVFDVTGNDDAIETQLSAETTDKKTEITVRNKVLGSSIRIDLKRRDSVSHYYAMKTLAAGQSKTFDFGAKLYIGTVPGLREGDILDGELKSKVKEIDLYGIKSADVVITGGGAEPFVFTLENIVR
ncbi:hypothetical protein [Flavobacterium sp. 3HN19-14]|uniref:hypothetical protein n=1 Tax=Flavobacterium sp. 3HN19-14 TaxID=3448133 RepID=UPI003EE2EE6B